MAERKIIFLSYILLLIIELGPGIQVIGSV